VYTPRPRVGTFHLSFPSQGPTAASERARTVPPSGPSALIERGFGEAYIATRPEIEMGNSYDEQMASRRLRVFFIL